MSGVQRERGSNRHVKACGEDEGRSESVATRGQSVDVRSFGLPQGDSFGRSFASLAMCLLWIGWLLSNWGPLVQQIVGRHSQRSYVESATA